MELWEFGATQYIDALYLNPMRRAITLSLALLSGFTGSTQSRSPKLKPLPTPVWFKNRNNVALNVGVGGFGYGLSIGGDYERIIGPRGRFSAHLPVYWSHSRDFFAASPGDYDRRHIYNAVLGAPGVRIHPGGAFSRIDYTIGARLAAGFLFTDERSMNWRGASSINTVSVVVAPQAELSFSIRAEHKNTRFGMYLAAGPSISGRFGSSARTEKLAPPLMEFGLRFGGSFQ